jgi:hypothetical protein
MSINKLAWNTALSAHGGQEIENKAQHLFAKPSIIA